MGDRVAVMRKGELQQVADPQTLYDRPVNLFVGGFIGSPAMNMVEATLEQRTAATREDRRADARSSPRGARGTGRRSRPTRASTVILGIRPEDLEDAALATETPADRGCRADGPDRGARLGDHGALRDRGEPAGRPRSARAGRGRRRRGAVRSSCRRTRRRSSAGSGARSRVAERRGRRGGRRHPRAPFLRSRHRPRDLRRSTKGAHSEEAPRDRCRDRGNGPPLLLIGTAAGAKCDERSRRVGIGATLPAVSGSITLRRDLDRLGSRVVRRGDHGVQQGLPERQGQLQAGRQQRLDGALRPRSQAVIPPDMADIAQPGYWSSSSSSRDT